MAIETLFSSNPFICRIYLSSGDITKSIAIGAATMNGNLMYSGNLMHIVAKVRIAKKRSNAPNDVLMRWIIRQRPQICVLKFTFLNKKITTKGIIMIKGVKGRSSAGIRRAPTILSFAALPHTMHAPLGLSPNVAVSIGCLRM